MAILRSSKASSRAPFSPLQRRMALALLALSASGCLVMDQLGWMSSGPAFSHKLHVEGEELYCIDCHMGYLDNEDAGAPRLKACMLCHEDFDEDAQPEYRAAAFYEDGKLIRQRVNALDLEVEFSHLEHVAEDEDSCLECHAEIVGSDSIEPWMAMDMRDCVECHEALGEETSCESCHSEIRADVAPRTHDGNWDRFHGHDVRNKSSVTVARCDMCHEESTCTTCHLEEMPQNHNNFWRRRSHGLMARMDRENCAACHQPDYCDRCHQEAVPQSHNGLWGSSRNTHCYGCHESDAQQSCFICHEAGTPSHSMAPPKPPGHNPVSDCRACHMIIPHVDNGANCNSCHL